MEKIISPAFSSNQEVATAPADKDRDSKQIKNFISEAVAYKSRYGYPSEKDKWLNKYRGGANLYEAAGKLPHQFRVNYFKIDVNSNCTVLSNQYPSYEVLRKDLDEDGINEDLMERIINDILDKNDIRRIEWNVIQWAGIKGTGVEGWEWNKDAECGLGFPSGESCDPGQVYINPGATSIAKSNYFYFVRPVPTNELKKAFPEFEKQIRPESDVSYDAGSNQDQSNGETNSAYIAQIGETMTWSGTNQTKEKQEQTRLYTIFWKDKQEIEIKNANELFDWIKKNPGFYGKSEYLLQKTYDELHDGDYPKKVKKFPFGRKICYASETILEDYPNPYNRIPFFEYQESPDPNSFWGPGIIEQEWEVISAIHVTTVDMAKNARHRLGPPFETWGYNVQDKKILKLKSGQAMVAKSPGAYCKPIQVPEVAPNDILSLIGYLDSQRVRITGIHPMLLGVRESGVYSGTYAEKLLDSAMGVLRPKFTRLNSMRKERVEFLIWMSQAYMTDERKFSYLNDEEKMEVEELNKRQSDQNGSGFEISPATNISIGQFEPKIEMGLERPMAKAERIAQTEKAANIMAEVDKKTAVRMILNDFDIPAKRRLIRRFNETYDSMMQQQAQMTQEAQQIQKAQIAQEMEIKDRNQAAEEKRAEVQVVKAGGSAQKIQMDLKKTQAEILNTEMEALEKLKELMGPQAVKAMLNEILAEKARENVNGL